MNDLIVYATMVGPSRNAACPLSGGRPAHVLVIEDEALMQQMLRDYLEQHNVLVVSALRSGVAAAWFRYRGSHMILVPKSRCCAARVKSLIDPLPAEQWQITTLRFTACRATCPQLSGHPQRSYNPEIAALVPKMVANKLSFAEARTEMINLRLLADDLTGALDTGAEFVGMTGPVDAFWHDGIPTVLPTNAAMDTGTRELDADAAMSVIAKLAPILSDAAIAFKKVDSLLRGPTFAEIAACMRVGGWRYAVMAPAFPYQGRVTRGRIQYARDIQGHWVAVSDDIVSRLATMGLQAHVGRTSTPLPAGISVFDAETDADLDCIVAACRGAGPVLWIGSGGLAQALARPTPPPSHAHLPLPLLGLFGSDHVVTTRQLAACGTDWTVLRDASPAEVRSVATRLRNTGRLLASLELPPNLDRNVAAGRIAAALHRLVRDLPPPGTLLVAGGETLRSLCLSFEARSLAVEGRLVPGVPRSRIRGGLWDGVTVVSKSGAFGPPNLLRDLLCRLHASTERMP